MAKRKGRGRLSNIDLLPKECDEVVAWAAKELAKRDKTQKDIYKEFEQQLRSVQEEYGLTFDIPSFKSFNRYSTRKAILTRRLDEMNKVAQSVAKVVGNDEADRSTIMLIQLIKQAVLEILEKGQLGSKELLDISRALSAVQNAKRASANDRRAHKSEKLADEQREQMDKAAHTATEGIVEIAPHLDAENVLAMIRGAYGIGGN